MATWQAECWLGSESGFQTLQVESNTHHGAKSQFEQIYGATQVRNVHQVSGSGGGGIGLPSLSGSVWLLGGLLFIGLLPYILPVLIIGGICWGLWWLWHWVDED
tara:strand:+ start:52 stop:363 length:312 start_codon:yes stop_codon:yes gene_type:complete